MKIKVLVCAVMCSASAFAYEGYGTYGSVPRVAGGSNEPYAGSLQERLDTVHREQEQREQERIRFQEQLNRMSPYERMTGGRSNFGYPVK